MVDRRLGEMLGSWRAASDDGRYTFGRPQTSPLEAVQPPTGLVRERFRREKRNLGPDGSDAPQPPAYGLFTCGGAT